MLQDLRLAIRALRATPVVTVVAVLSLALGIGANTAIFSLVDRLTLRSLPVHEPARLALVATTARLSYTPNYSYAVFDAVAAQTELFDGVLAVGNCCGQSTLAVGDSHEFVDRLFVSGSYFATLGVNALFGRVLTPADDERRTRSFAGGRRLGSAMALGAGPAIVIRLVLARVSALVAAGIAVGAALALGAARFVTALLYGLEPRDPVTLAGAVLTLVAVGALAGWLPAYRASRIDPAEVLRGVDHVGKVERHCKRKTP